MRWITDLGSVYFKSGFIVTVVVIDLYLIKHPWICSHKAALLIIILSPKGRYWLTECVVTLLFSCSVLSDSLRPHELQHTRLPYPSLFPWICSNSYPLSQWYLPTISSSGCPQSFPASGSFPMSWLFASGGQILELQLQHQSFQRIFRVDFLSDWLVWSPCCPRDSH